MTTTTHPKGYLKGCNCDRCERQRTRQREYMRTYKHPDPEKVRENDREKRRKRAARRHGGAAEWARMWAEQDGRCYLCQRPMLPGQEIHVDHDHTCCYNPKDTDSCSYCRRGLTHAACNQIWGLAAENPDVLRAIASQGERVAEATRARITAKPEQGELLPA